MACDFDIIALTETWLNSSFYDSELFQHTEFSVFRSDRCYEELNCERGGGVLIAVPSTVQASQVYITRNNGFEDVWVQFLFEDIKLILGCVYLPPGSSLECFQSFCDTCELLKNKYDSHKFILFGDFNLPLIDWVVEDGILVPRELPTPASRNLVDSMFFLELEQINYVRNDGNRILDLVFVDEFEHLKLLPSVHPLLPLDSFHPALEVLIELKHTPTLKINNRTTFYQFRRGDYESLHNFFSQADWSFLSTTPDIDMLVGHFYKLVFEGIDRFVPKHTMPSQKYPIWFDTELRKLIAQKNKLYKRYMRSNNQVDYEAYSSLRREVNFRTDFCYMLFISNMEHLIPENVKHFWTFIKNLKGVSGLPGTMHYNNNTLSNPSEISNAFAAHFQSSYCVYEGIDIASAPRVDFASTLSAHYFTSAEIIGKIMGLDTAKGAGPDGIPPLFLKNCCQSLTEPLRLLFQRSMDIGVFPATWKYSGLLPVFKSGDKADISNYRGIAILSAIPKLFESIITDEIFSTFKNYIIPQQHGFYSGRSTTTNLAIYQNFLISSLEAGRQVDCIYTDLSKAFDCVCHPLLLRKLSDMGVAGSYFRWITSYLSCRRQHVTICGSVSREVVVTSGVPQGSHIGPVLFVLFVNDVVSCFQSSQFLMYADDLKLFSIVGPEQNGLLADLDLFVEWCRRNYLNLNVSKCKVITFSKCRLPTVFNYSINSVNAERVTSFNDLGIIFDCDLNFNMHIDNIVLKGLRMLGFIKRHTKHILDTRAVTCLYNSLVRSILEYCSTIWSPNYICHIERLERVQRKFVKYLLFKHHFPSLGINYSTRLLLCGIKTLECRRRDALLIFLYKLLNGTTQCSELLEQILLLVPVRTTRHRQLFFERTHRTNYGLTAFVDRIVNNYNQFYSQHDLFFLSLNSVKNILKLSIVVDFR